MSQSLHVQIIDGIGAHSGMQAYNSALAQALDDGGCRATIYSNYLDPRFGNTLGWVLPNFYVGSVAINVGRMFACGRDVFRYARRVDDADTFWLLHFHGATLGNLIFFAALALACGRRRHGLIVHDVTSIHRRENAFFRWVKTTFYRHAPRLAVVHGDLAAEQLRAIGFRGALMQTELFRSSDADVAPPARVDDPQLAAVLASSRHRVLLFGSIRASKGLDTALAALRLLPQAARDALLLVVAGRDSGGLIGSPGHEIPDDGSVAVLDRFVSNEERAALFAASNVVILPYRNIYQSGVLDVAVSHRVPVLASSLPPFQQFFDDYPSFGRVFGRDASELAASLQEQLLGGTAPRAAYSEADLSRHAAANPALTFARELRAALAQLS